MGYFGCGTRSNRIGWSLFAVFTIFGVVFLGTFVQQFYSCYDEYDRCMTDLLLQEKITRQEYKKYHRSRGQTYYDDDDIGKTDNKYINNCEMEELEECDERVLGLFAALVLCFVIASLPLYVMCCCSHSPPFKEGQFSVVQLPIQAITGRIKSMTMSRKRSESAQNSQKGADYQDVNMQIASV